MLWRHGKYRRKTRVLGNKLEARCSKEFLHRLMLRNWISVSLSLKWVCFWCANLVFKCQFYIHYIAKGYIPQGWNYIYKHTTCVYINILHTCIYFLVHLSGIYCLTTKCMIPENLTQHDSLRSVIAFFLIVCSCGILLQKVDWLTKLERSH